MEEQISASNFPPVQQGITPEQLEQLKARAREEAIMQSLSTTAETPTGTNHTNGTTPWSPKTTSCVC
jgi:hypothetical protein